MILLYIHIHTSTIYTIAYQLKELLAIIIYRHILINIILCQSGIVKPTDTNSILG